jgi:hypothetical protein
MNAIRKIVSISAAPLFVLCAACSGSSEPQSGAGSMPAPPPPSELSHSQAIHPFTAPSLTATEFGGSPSSVGYSGYGYTPNGSVWIGIWNTTSGSGFWESGSHWVTASSSGTLVGSPTDSVYFDCSEQLSGERQTAYAYDATKGYANGVGLAVDPCLG